MVQIKYCPTDDMKGNYMSKSLEGVKFDKFRNIIIKKNNNYYMCLSKEYGFLSVVFISKLLVNYW